MKSLKRIHVAAYTTKLLMIKGEAREPEVTLVPERADRQWSSLSAVRSGGYDGADISMARAIESSPIMDVLSPVMTPFDEYIGRVPGNLHVVLSLTASLVFSIP